MKNAFCHGDWTVNVLMDLSLGFIWKKKICKLKKAFYELKQSPRARFRRLSPTMREYGFKQTLADDQNHICLLSLC